MVKPKQMFIRQLPAECVNKIAAGEIVHRPVNAIKELIENSLDAEATVIRIIIQTSGLNEITISDNGTGIASCDAQNVCKRFSTSKITCIEDLTKIETFGFRGEALSSISEVGELEIQSYCPNLDQSGWHANYMSGNLMSFGEFNVNQGTCIIVKNLFNNFAHRRKALLHNVNDEKKVIIELVTRYAIYNASTVTMSLMDATGYDLICSVAPCELKPSIGSFFGLEIENNMIEFNVCEKKTLCIDSHIVFSYTKTGSPKVFPTFILFINNRLVECNQLKRELSAVAQNFFNPKQTNYLFYIAMKVNPSDIDVNVHPTKATVTLHLQDEVNSLMSSELRKIFEERLSISTMIVKDSTSKFASSQALLMLESSPQVSLSCSHQNSQSAPKTSKSVLISPQKRPSKLVHTDATERKLTQSEELVPVTGNNFIAGKRYRREIKLKSRQDLLNLVGSEVSDELKELIKGSVFVGIFDHDHALIQNATKLIAIDFRAFYKELLYQFYLFDFGNFPPIDILPPGNKIRHFIDTYLEDLQRYDRRSYDLLTFNSSDSVLDKLNTYKEMFEDYFMLIFNHEEILTLPCIFPELAPNMAYLGEFLVKLANDVDYNDEKECFRTAGRVLVHFYSIAPSNLKDRTISMKYHHLVDNKLYYAIKRYLLPPRWLLDPRYVSQISDTQDLYKVFERC